MGEVCRVCTHPQLPEIDAALLADEPVRATARMFGLTEASLRRHAANHRMNTAMNATEEGPEMDHSGPTQPVTAATDLETPNDDVRSVARRRLEQEEAERRAGRLAALEAEERGRRDRAAAEIERAAALEAARAEADELAARRAVVEDRAEIEAATLKATLYEAEDLYVRESRVRSRAGVLPPGLQLFPHIVQRWIPSRLGHFAPGGRLTAAVDPYGNSSLRGRDPLTKTADARVNGEPPPAA